MKKILSIFITAHMLGVSPCLERYQAAAQFSKAPVQIGLPNGGFQSSRLSPGQTKINTPPALRINSLSLPASIASPMQQAQAAPKARVSKSPAQTAMQGISREMPDFGKMAQGESKDGAENDFMARVGPYSTENKDALPDATPDSSQELKNVRRELAKELITKGDLWRLARLAQEGIKDEALLKNIFEKTFYRLSQETAYMFPGGSGRRLVSTLERIATQTPYSSVQKLFIEGVMTITRHYGDDTFARYAVQSVKRVAVNSPRSRDVRKKAIEVLERRIYRQKMGRSSNVPSRREIQSAIDEIKKSRDSEKSKSKAGPAAGQQKISPVAAYLAGKYAANHQGKTGTLSLRTVFTDGGVSPDKLEGEVFSRVTDADGSYSETTAQLWVRQSPENPWRWEGRITHMAGGSYDKYGEVNAGGGGDRDEPIAVTFDAKGQVSIEAAQSELQWTGRR